MARSAQIILAILAIAASAPLLLFLCAFGQFSSAHVVSVESQRDIGSSFLKFDSISRHKIGSTFTTHLDSRQSFHPLAHTQPTALRFPLAGFDVLRC